MNNAQQNREAMPTIASVKDKFREVFGDSVRVTYASENGIELGRKQACEGVTVPTPVAPPKREASIPTTTVKRPQTRRP